MKKMFQERQPEIELKGKKPERLLQIVLWKPTPTVSHWHGRHFMKYNRIKKEWLARMALVLRHNSVYFAKARITAYRYARYKIRDPENANGGLKPVIDSLVDLGLLHNDTSKQLPKAPTVVQTKVSNGKDERTVLIIEELQ